MWRRGGGKRDEKDGRKKKKDARMRRCGEKRRTLGSHLIALNDMHR